MLYLSIILILCGVVILLYSISVEVRKYPGGAPAGEGGFYPDAPEQARTYERGDDADLPRSPAVLHNMPEGRNAGFVTPDNSHPKTGEAKGDERKDRKAEEANAVLYEDSSNLVNYRLAEGTLDPTAEEYKKILRVGRGSLFYEKNGISFHMKNRFYRFDFHRYEDFAVGDNYIAVKLKGGGSTKLFIVEDNRSLISSIGEQYTNYQR